MNILLQHLQEVNSRPLLIDELDDFFNSHIKTTPTFQNVTANTVYFNKIHKEFIFCVDTLSIKYNISKEAILLYSSLETKLINRHIDISHDIEHKVYVSHKHTSINFISLKINYIYNRNIEEAITFLEKHKELLPKSTQTFIDFKISESNKKSKILSINNSFEAKTFYSTLPSNVNLDTLTTISIQYYRITDRESSIKSILYFLISIKSKYLNESSEKYTLFIHQNIDKFLSKLERHLGGNTDNKIYFDILEILKTNNNIIDDIIENLSQKRNFSLYYLPTLIFLDKANITKAQKNGLNSCFRIKLAYETKHSSLKFKDMPNTLQDTLISELKRQTIAILTLETS